MGRRILISAGIAAGILAVLSASWSLSRINTEIGFEMFAAASASVIAAVALCVLSISSAWIPSAVPGSFGDQPAESPGRAAPHHAALAVSDSKLPPEGEGAAGCESSVELSIPRVKSEVLPALIPNSPGTSTAVAGTERSGAARRSITLDDRILLHLSGLRRAEPGELYPAGCTQDGISRNLSIQQGRISSRLKTLVLEGWIDEPSKQHVEGKASRLYVYSLTPQGKRRASEIRRTDGDREGWRASYVPSNAGSVRAGTPP
jgi:hypothetical protein